MGWQPDASWPPAPPGWDFWPDAATDTPPPPPPGQPSPGQPLNGQPAGVLGGPAQGAWGRPGGVGRPRPTAAWWAVAGGVAVTLAPAFPFVDQQGLDVVRVVTINSGALVVSGLFGATLTGLALGMLSRARGLAIVELVLSAVGFLGYVGFAVAGAVGVPSDTGLGFSVTVKWDPGFGLLLSILGCLVVVVAAVVGLRMWRAAARG